MGKRTQRKGRRGVAFVEKWINQIIKEEKEKEKSEAKKKGAVETPEKRRQ
jgi:hypothetical protein